MKTANKTIVRLIVGCVFACCLISKLHAQTHPIPWLLPQGVVPAGNPETLQSDPLQTEINSLPQVPADMVPKTGTFWSLQESLLTGNYPPLPCNPFASANPNLDVKVYALQDGSL